METTSQLKQVLALARYGNYRRAARSLGITHSALSHSLKRLEDFYGSSLFAREGNMSVPTAAGRRLITAAESVLGTLSKTQSDIKGMLHLEAGRLTVGVDPSVSETVLTAPLIDLLNTYPRLQFAITPTFPNDAESMLQAETIDMFVGLAPDRRSEDTDYTDIAVPPPALVCRPGHDLSRSPASIDELMQYPFVGGLAPDWFLERVRQKLPDQFKSLDDVREIFLTTFDLGMCKAILKQTDAIGLLPSKAVKREINLGELIELQISGSDPFPAVPAVIAVRTGRSLPPSAAQLIRRLRHMH